MEVHFRWSATACMRVQLGLSQQQLANSLGISRSALALAETGRRPIPEAVQLLLRQMMEVAATMPATGAGNKRRCKKTGALPGRSNNRVRNAARLYTVTKKPFVTAQRSVPGCCKPPAMTRYASVSTSVSNFSTHLLQSPFDCRELLNTSAIKQSRMQGWLAYLELEARAAVIRGKELTAELLYVNTLLQLNQEQIEKYPLSPAKRKLEHRNAKLHCRRLILEDRLEHFDATAMVLREYNINVLVKQLELLEQLTSAVEKMKVELEYVDMRRSFLSVQKDLRKGNDAYKQITIADTDVVSYRAA